jgi:hypothetical protein
MEPQPRPWSLARKVAAYAVLSALALAAIYLVDLKAHRPPDESPPAALPAGSPAPSPAR